jgi:hypothetical protein
MRKDKKCGLLLLLTGLLSCGENKQIASANKYEFVYSRADVGQGAHFSLKFSNSDTLFFQNYKYNPEKQVVYALLGEEDKDKLNDLVGEIKWLDLDSAYVQPNLQDGSGYNFYLKRNGSQKTIYIYGKEGPEQLYKLSLWLEELQARKQQEYQVTKTKVAFGDLRRVVYPEVLIPTK